MFLVTLVLALMCVLAAARSITARNDGRGATIYTSTKFGGRLFAIPGSNYCTSLNEIYGDFDAKTRSIIIDQGYRCEFYTSYDCAEKSPYAHFGSPRMPISVPFLRPDYDSTIHSVYCTSISAVAAADIGRNGVQYMTPPPASRRSNADSNRKAAVLHTASSQGGYALVVKASGECYSMSTLPNSEVPDLIPEVRSAQVEAGVVCHFFSQTGCYSESLPVTGAQTLDRLPESFEGRIQSVMCLPAS
ncbi:hypothetical protein T440DRAFT_469237 [Plenodomus tracheiphilus IPT5]|uniref:Uncharacterized protein n=1 Tax=Plenodomus tracheiphilus IPT5 TaxID=1408161 RepID=A0A6A7B1S9_9PLEO|nr:hypothetical protein T440DRAFT_469237 [Plenodomus tracheiphilus IPT5]